MTFLFEATCWLLIIAFALTPVVLGLAKFGGF